MNNRFLTIAILLTAVIFAACCPCRFTRKNAKPLKGTTWHLVQLNGRDVQFGPETFNVVFGTEGRLTGIGACNRFSASYESTDKETLDIGVIASTRMYCPDSEFEQKLFFELDEATHYEIDGAMLLLLNNGEIRAIFSAVESSDNL